jgi:LacI family transcriptional regulator
VEHAIHHARKTMVLRHVYSDKNTGDALLFSRADGVLVFGDLSDPHLVRQVEDMPVVQMMHAALPGERWDRVTYDNAKIGPLVADYAMAKGHQCCAFAGHICNRAEMAMQQRGLDFRTAMNAKGGKVHLLLRDLLHVTDSIHTVHQTALLAMVDELVTLVPKPTLLFVEADMVAQSIYPVLKSRGLQPGRDIEVVSCNNEAILLAGLAPRPATVDIHATEIGRKAVQRLLWRIRNPHKPVDTILIAPSLVTANSPM